MNRLSHYIKQHNIISTAQHGFRKNLSTLTAFHSFYNNLITLLERGEYPTGIYIDLSRAFDCVDYKLLIAKLERYGIRGVASGWFESYLHGRRQCVKIRHTDRASTCTFISKSEPVCMGVPQGSILGPFLFVLFINDLVGRVDVPIFMYADDTTALVDKSPIFSMEERCNETLRQLSEWFAENKLVVNPRKTMCVRFKNPHCILDSLNLRMNSDVIASTDTCRFLGIHIDENLKWDRHCRELCKALNSVCYQVRRLKLVLTEQQLRSFYFACVQSRLCYGVCFWGSSAGSRAVFIAQKRIVRVLAGVSPGTPCRPLFARLNLLPLPCLHIQELALFIFKGGMRHQTVSQIHSYPTRGRHDIYIDNRRLKASCKSPVHLGSSIYNRLPNEFRHIPNINVFKSRLNLFLCSKLYYSLDEFLK